MKDEKEESNIVLGMVMLEDENKWTANSFLADYKDYYYASTDDDITGEDYSDVFTINGESVGLMFMPVPIPHGDIEGTAKYAYNWVSAEKDIEKHQSHIIVSIMGGTNDQIKRYRIFTQIICSLLRTTKSIGVYIGGQSLLIRKKDYLNQAALMSDDYMPLNLWVYFGLRKTSRGKSGYTYGLTAFGKTEMEVVNSSKSLKDIRSFLFNMAHYVLEYDVIFKDGQTCGLSAEERIAITFSKGKFVKGESFKLAY